MSARRILLTGGSGTLGTELRTLVPGMFAPAHHELDLLNSEMVMEGVRALSPDLIVHAAAYTDVAAAEEDRAACWALNVGGTHAIVAAARASRSRLVHISTDYVFPGDAPAGNGYREDDPPGPVRNYYALSKLAAEEIARTLDGSLVIRTSFRPREWPYPVAFADVHTSQDYIDVIAPEIALAIRNIDRIEDRTLHIATERKSVYDLAKRRKPDVRRGSKHETRVALPDDITLDIARWKAIKAQVLP